MSAIFDSLLAFIAQHPHLAYGVVFLIALSESLAFIGLVVPGTLLMFGIGAVVATGNLDLVPVLILATLGAIAGDAISYWFGRHYKDRLANIWPFSRHPAMLKKGESFFHRHGAKSVFLGRFIGPIRPVIPVIAGMMNMPPLRFSIVNILSAIGWAIANILPGVLFAASLSLAGAISARLAALLLIFVTALWALVWISRRLWSLLERRGTAWHLALRQWAASPSTSAGGRWTKRLVAHLAFTDHHERLLLVFLLLIMITAALGLLGVLQQMLAQDPLVYADQSLYQLLQSLHTPWATDIFVTITELSDAFASGALFAVVLFILLLRRNYRTALFWALAAAGGVLAIYVLQWAIQRHPAAMFANGASGFPSSATTMNVVLYGFLAILIAHHTNATWRWSLVVVVGLIGFFVGFAELYLGNHWLSSVLSGYLIGAIWVALIGIVFLQEKDRPLPKRLLGGAVLALLIFIGSWHVARKHDEDLARYTPTSQTKIIERTSWEKEKWQQLPTYRIDLEGEEKQPLIMQWAGSPAALTQQLLAQQWKVPSGLSMKGALSMLSPETAVGELPVLPRLHNGFTDVVRLVQPAGPTRRWVLRLWPSRVVLAPTDTPVFEGALELQEQRHLARLIFLTRDSRQYDQSVDKLRAELQGHFALVRVERAITEPRHTHWNGEVLLVNQKQ